MLCRMPHIHLEGQVRHGNYLHHDDAVFVVEQLMEEYEKNCVVGSDDTTALRNRAAIAAMQKLIDADVANHDEARAISVAQNAVAYADALVRLLRVKKED